MFFIIIIIRDLGGDYRSLLAKADDLTFSLIHYNDPEASLCNTDLDRINSKPEPENIEGKTISRNRLFSFLLLIHLFIVLQRWKISWVTNEFYTENKPICNYGIT